MRKKFFATFVVLFAVALVVSGCGGKKAGVGQGPAVGAGVGQDGGGTVADSDAPEGLPDGWSVYQGTAVPVSFWLPPGWGTTELGNAVLLRDVPFPDPLPPEIYDATVTISVSQETDEQIKDKLESDDGGGVSDQIMQVNGQAVRKFTYSVEVPEQHEVSFYRIPKDDKFIQVAVDASWDGTLEFTAILNHLVLRRAQ